MENGIGIAEDAKLGEEKAVETKALVPSKEESAKLSLDESENSKGDEVFEDAVEAPSPSSGSEIGSLTNGGSAEDGSLILDNNQGNSDASHEVHKPEEVIGAPGAVQIPEDSGDKVELPVSEENHDEMQSATEENETDATNGVMEESTSKKDESIVEDGESDCKEINDSAAAGETEILYDGTEINQKLDKSNENSEDSISNKMSYADVVKIVDGGVTREETETLKPDELSRADTDSIRTENDGYVYEMTEIHEANQVKGGDIISDLPENGSLDHEGVKSADSETLKEQIHEISREAEDADMVEGSGAGLSSESFSNGDIPHNNMENAFLGSGHQNEKLENNRADLHSEPEGDLIGDPLETSSISCANLKADENNKEQVESFENQQVEENENRGFAATDTSAMEHARKKSGGNADQLNLGTAEAESNSCSSKLLAENSVSAQHQLVGASAEVPTAGVEAPEQEVKDEKDLNVSGSKEQEVQEPVFRDKVQESISNDKPVNAQPDIKPAADVPSSARSVTPQPAGLGHSSQLPQPASQNKEHVSKSTANIPSTNATSSTPARPAGLGRAAPLLEPTPRVVQQGRVNGAASSAPNRIIEEPTNAEAEEYDETREKLQMIRVKFLRLAHRLGQTTHNVVVAQVLYRLGLAEQLHGRSGGRVAAFSFDRASAMAGNLEATGQEPLDFTCTIMVLGKSGVGKSATINSIFDQNMFGTDAFQCGTKRVQDIVGTVQGIRVRVIDTPGLLPSWSDQRQNEKILHSVKKFIKTTPPDIVLYLDRLDMQSRDSGDMPLLRTITEIFGPSIWFNAIVVLTHAASAPPEGPNGTTTSYDMFVTQRSHVVQQAIRQAAGDMRLMNPVSLVENHSACRTNPAGQRVLPNGQVWKPHLLLLSFASKILAEANTLLKLQDTPPGRPFAPRVRSPPLPALLSSLLQSRPEVKLPSEQFGDDDDDAMDDDLDEGSESDEDSEYDTLPPFKSLTKAQLEKLNRSQRKAYYEELEYREKLFLKKQLKEERKRRKMMKKMREAAKDIPPSDYNNENVEEETNAAASVPVAMPDITLPASFDSDNPTHRYRSLDSSNPWLVRAVLEPNGWDHDIGYDGINVERLFVVQEKVPISFSGHISKDKKDTNLQMEVASSIKHEKGKATSLGFDMQSVGKDYAYTLRGETRFSNKKINKASAGLSATVLGDVVTGGVKLEDKLVIGKRGQVVVSGGAIYGRGEVAYGGNLEATLKDKDHPVGRFLSTLGISVMDWHGDLAIGCNSQTQIPIGRHMNLIGRFSINNRGSGQVSVRVNSSDQLQIILIGLIPLVKKVLGYFEQMQYG